MIQCEDDHDSICRLPRNGGRMMVQSVLLEKEADRKHTYTHTLVTSQ